MTTRTLEIPIIVNVYVEVRDGLVTPYHAEPDNDAAPWPYSSDPTAWEPETGEWHEGRNDEDPDVEAAWLAAYDAIKVTVEGEERKEEGSAITDPKEH
jgi:hypothetical protein